MAEDRAPGLEGVRAGVDRLQPLAAAAEEAVREGLRAAATTEDYAQLRLQLVELGAGATAFAERLGALVGAVERSAAEWKAARQYTEAGLAELEVELGRALGRRAADGVRRWLNALFDAVRAGEVDSAARIAELPLELPPALEQGRSQVRALVQRFGSGDLEAAAALMAAIAGADVPSWNRVLDTTIRSRAHRLAAYFALRQAHDADAARTALDAAVELDPLNALNYSERAAYWLFVGELERGASDAQHAIELEPSEPAGYLMFGLWAELTAEFEDAEELYGRAFERMTGHAVAAIARRGSLIDPSGLMLAVAGEHLLDAGRPEAALDLADAASAVGVRGQSLRPDARVHRLRRRSLEQLPGRRADAAAAAVDAGMRFIWGGASAEAVEELERAIELDPGRKVAYWLLADALTSISFPEGAAVADPERLVAARAAWATGAALGLPTGDESWAYLTRASLSDLESQHTPDRRRQGLWAAVVDCERALVHDPLDSLRWGFLARFLRSLGLDELAFEAVETGYQLNESDVPVLYQRLALLGNRGRFEDAEDVALKLVAMTGEDPWVVGAQAWLAHHAGRHDEALTLLDLPLSRGFDRSWYLDLRALCHLALDDVAAARDDYHEIVIGVRDRIIPVTDPAVTALHALALAVAGDIVGARERVEGAREGITASDDTSAPALDAFIAFAAGESERAADRLHAAVDLTITGRDLDDLFTQLPLRLRALDARLALAGLEVVERVRTAFEPHRREVLATEPVGTADSELARLLAEGAEQSAGVGVTAIDARRRLLGGDLQGAIDRYHKLRGTSFEPEATVALARALRELSARESAKGDVDLTRRAQEQLVALGQADQVDTALAVASALAAAGQPQQAHDVLAAAAGRPAGDARRDLVEQGLGELELVADDPEAAATHFDRALHLARGGEDPTRLAQIETRAALARLLSGNSSDATRHVVDALQAWHEAGAFEAPITILQEARAVLARTADSSHLRRAFGLLASLVEGRAAPTESRPKPDHAGDPPAS